MISPLSERMFCLAIASRAAFISLGIRKTNGASPCAGCVMRTQYQINSKSQPK
jgi:hypothetical protein